MPTHTVGQGECISSIAEDYGFQWSTVWNHANNAALRARRKDPNVLFPGDEVFVPEREIKEVTAATDQKHKFVKKGVPAKLRLRLMDVDQPRANTPYRLEIDGKWIDGSTDDDGMVEQSIPPNARRGMLLVGSGPTQDVYEFDFGTVDPLDTAEGVAQRLNDLGYETGEAIEEAIRGFQHNNELNETGQVDEATRQKLKEAFGQ